MATFLLIPGAGAGPWYWHRVAPLLEQYGHTVITPDLPVDDDTAGFAEYTDTAVAALPDPVMQPLVVVGQSMGAYTAVRTCERVSAALLVLTCPMIPRPGESGGEWWASTRQPDAAREYANVQGRDPDAPFDPLELFLHDVSREVVTDSAAHVRDQSETPFAAGWDGPDWPAVPTRVIAGRYDRLFPLGFMQGLSRERLGIEPDVIDSGHLSALARPDDLTALLIGYLAELKVA